MGWSWARKHLCCMGSEEPHRLRSIITATRHSADFSWQKEERPQVRARQSGGAERESPRLAQGRLRTVDYSIAFIAFEHEWNMLQHFSVWFKVKQPWMVFSCWFVITAFNGRFHSRFVFGCGATLFRQRRTVLGCLVLLSLVWLMI